MLAEMFPRIHGRVAALWVLGPLLDEFVGWLHARGFPRLPIRLRVRAAPRLAARLRRRGIRDIGELSRDDLLALAPRDAAADVYLGRRDYAIFLLIATYGLRTSEVAGLRLDDVEWRASRLRVRRPKTQTPLVLPLTDAVGAALLDYLRHARPPRPACRALFLRVRAPAGPLARTGVTEAFQGWTRRSRLPIPYHGPHWPQTAEALALLIRESRLDPDATHPLFRSRRAQPLTRFGARYLLRKYVARVQATVPTLTAKRVHPHTVRHTTAVHLLQAGVDLVTISHWLGHASVETTNRYAAVDLEMKRAAIAKAHPTGLGDTAAAWRRDATILDWLEAL